MTEIDYSAYLARSIRTARVTGELSQADLAKAVKAQGFPFYQVTVHRIENGLREVRVPELFALASALGVTAGDLLPEIEIADGTPRVRRAFYGVARAVVTGQMDERIGLAWQVFSNSLKGGAS